MFIWDFVADKILGQIVDWFYSQVVGFLGNFFSEMGSMGAELFEMNWVQSVVLFFSYLGWALFATGLVVAVKPLAEVNCQPAGVPSSGQGAASTSLPGWASAGSSTPVSIRVTCVKKVASGSRPETRKPDSTSASNQMR